MRPRFTIVKQVATVFFMKRKHTLDAMVFARMSKADVARITRAADKAGVPVSVWVRTIVRQALDMGIVRP